MSINHSKKPALDQVKSGRQDNADAPGFTFLSGKTRSGEDPGNLNHRPNPVPKNRTSGLMSGGWKRSLWQAIQAPVAEGVGLRYGQPGRYCATPRLPDTTFGYDLAVGWPEIHNPVAVEGPQGRISRAQRIMARSSGRLPNLTSCNRLNRPVLSRQWT